MKKLCGILCLLAFFWELSYAVPRSSRSLQCEEALKRNTNSAEERKEKILSWKKQNSYATPATLAGEIGVSISTIKKDIAELKEAGRLEENKPRRAILPEEIIEPIQETMRENPQTTRVQLTQKTGALISTVDKALAILIKEAAWELIGENRHITRAQLVQKINVEIPTVKIPTIDKAIDILREERGLMRVGTRGGLWRVRQEGEAPPQYDSPEEREEKILALIRENRYITNAQIAEKLGLQKRTVSQTTARLKKKKLLKRHGTRDGWREIL